MPFQVTDYLTATTPSTCSAISYRHLHVCQFLSEPDHHTENNLQVTGDFMKPFPISN